MVVESKLDTLPHRDGEVEINSSFLFDVGHSLKNLAEIFLIEQDLSRVREKS